MHPMLRTAAAALLFALEAGGASVAQEFGFDEIRGGIFGHSVDDGTFLSFERLEDVNVELLFTPISTGIIGDIRPNLGATVNFGGLESMVYGGLSWKIPLLDTPVFVEGGFGAALHNGERSGAAAPARNLGCPVLFHEQLSIGYDLTESLSIMGTIEHASHAGLCGSENEGLTNAGIRVGWRF